MEKRKGLGIGGSPRIKGNTNLLLREALSGAESVGMETEIVYACRLENKGCLSCQGCDETGRCVVQDGMQILYPKLFEASLILLASPIYFSGITAQLKAVIDRSQCIWTAHYRLKQPVCAALPCRLGGFISTRGQKGFKVFECAEIPPRAFFNTIKAKYTKGLFFDDCDPSGIMQKRPEDLKKAFEYGKGLARRIITG